ncbi:MAG: hypothetical protein C5B58_02810 [Acidobacteria bacterium]|nr:MAG: hypothetical protein C5B58_02810 [Acidobacteriota bacterium]
MYLLESKAVKLKPSIVIVGFYFGNDLADAFARVYSKDYFKQFRTSEFAANSDNEGIGQIVSDNGGILGSVRYTLSRHSVLYRSAMLAFGDSLRFTEMKYTNSPDITVFDAPSLGIRTGFTPIAISSVLNLNDPTIREGLRLTLDLFEQMKGFCDARAIRFYVVLLPTKESVFSRYIDSADFQLPNQAAIHAVIESEGQVKNLMTGYFKEHDIDFIDVAKPLAAAVGSQQIYPENADVHPNKYGYQIIAKTIGVRLQSENRRPE